MVTLLLIYSVETMQWPIPGHGKLIRKTVKMSLFGLYKINVPWVQETYFLSMWINICLFILLQLLFSLKTNNSPWKNLKYIRSVKYSKLPVNTWEDYRKIPFVTVNYQLNKHHCGAMTCKLSSLTGQMSSMGSVHRPDPAWCWSVHKWNPACQHDPACQIRPWCDCTPVQLRAKPDPGVTLCIRCGHRVTVNW